MVCWRCFICLSAQRLRAGGAQTCGSVPSGTTRDSSPPARRLRSRLAHWERDAGRAAAIESSDRSSLRDAGLQRRIDRQLDRPLCGRAGERRSFRTWGWVRGVVPRALLWAGIRCPVGTRGGGEWREGERGLRVRLPFSLGSNPGITHLFLVPFGTDLCVAAPITQASWRQ